MQANISQYTVKINDLSEGCNHFVFKMADAFFQHFQNPEFTSGNFEADIYMDKKSDLIVCDCSITGTVNIVCDRCLDRFDLPVSYEGFLYIKSGKDQKEEGVDVMYIHEQEKEINLAQYIYESICLSTPCKRAHPDDENGFSTCNKDMLAKLEEHSPPEHNREPDMRWSKLKNLIKNKN